MRKDKFSYYAGIAKGKFPKGKPMTAQQKQGFAFAKITEAKKQTAAFKRANPNYVRKTK